MKRQQTYQEKLLDPRWQKKRLKILEARSWTCEDCGDETKTLHVHHGVYLKGKMPWEYDDDQLHVLCSKCHESRTDIEDAIRIIIAPWKTNQVQNILSIIQSIKDLKENAEDVAFDNGGIEGFAAALSK